MAGLALFSNCSPTQLLTFEVADVSSLRAIEVRGVMSVEVLQPGTALELR
jgi:hypothetical protein